MCIWLPLLLMLGAALLSWFAAKAFLQSRIEEEFSTKNQELNDNYQSLNTDFLAYIEKHKQVESGYTSLLKERDNLKTEHQSLTFKLSAAAAEREKQSAEYQGSLSILENKFKELESSQVTESTAFAAAPVREIEVIKEVIVERIVNVPVEVTREVYINKTIEVPVEKIVEIERIVEVPFETIKEIEVIREIFVDKIVEVPFETIKEVEVIREIFVDKIVNIPFETIREIEVIREIFVDKIVEVPFETIKEVEIIREIFVDKIVEIEKIVEVEVIREIEVTREIDMNSLMTMLGQMGTVEVSRTTRDTDRTETSSVGEAYLVKQEAVISPVEDVAAAVVETRRDDLTIVEGIGPKIAELLNNSGIYTFEQLANTDVATLQAILENAGPRFQMHKADTWAEQSLYAANGQWDELKTWQDTLNGGKK